MKHRKMILLAGALCLLTAGCADSSSAPESDAALSSAEESSEEDSSAANPYDYVHGEEGYFSLADVGLAPVIKTQEHSTGWAYSASSAMESEYLSGTQKLISIDPRMIVDAVYGKDKKEGWFLKGNADPLDAGGDCWQIVQTMTNGCGDWMMFDAEDYEGVSREELQSELCRRGALNVNVPDHEDAFKMCGEYMTMNDPGLNASDYNHAVILIGWDDNFPSTYFRKPASQHGAWLVQDSHSDRSAYYWLSYDTPLFDVFSYSLTDMYGELESYDAGKMQKISAGTDSGETAVANVFHHGGVLRGIGTFTSVPFQNMTVEVRDGEFGDLIYTQTASFPYKGYHMITLDEQPKVGDCTVVVRFDGLAPVEGESFERDNKEFRVTSAEGQSFVEIGGEWMDLAKPETAEALGIDFEPNNACIKAFYVKEE